MEPTPPPTAAAGVTSRKRAFCELNNEEIPEFIDDKTKSTLLVAPGPELEPFDFIYMSPAQSCRATPSEMPPHIEPSHPSSCGSPTIEGEPDAHDADPLYAPQGNNSEHVWHDFRHSSAEQDAAWEDMEDMEDMEDLEDLEDLRSVAAGTASEDGSDLFIPEDHNEFDAESETASQASVEVAPEAPRKKQRRAPPPRVFSARAYWQRYFEQTPPSKTRGLSWRREELGRIEQAAPSLQKMTPRKPQKKRGAVQGTALRGLRNHKTFDEDYVNPQQDTEPGIKASTKKGLFKEFIDRASKSGKMDLKKVREDIKYLDKASKTYGYGKMLPQNGHWKLEGMKTTLYNHQMTGVSWMVERECSPDGPFGGILADDMGLGKTIQVFGTMIANSPTQHDIDTNFKTTLIVVMSSLRFQWYDEIKKHTSYEPYVFKSSNENNSVGRLTREDIVLTTYHEVMKSLPFPDKETIEKFKKKKINIEKAIQCWINQHVAEVGLLHQVDWYRIIFDEGHLIKNFKIRTTKAAIALKGTYRWSLSGTPIMNKYEGYSTLCFLRDPLTLKYDYTKFQTQFCDPEDETSFEKLECLLTELILRRSMQDRILGQPILPLEKPTREVWKVKLPLPERLLYQAVEKRFLELLNQHLPKSDPRQKMTYSLCQLTRLRQLVSNADIIDLQLEIMFDDHELIETKGEMKALKVPKKLIDLQQTLVSRLDMWINRKVATARKSKAQTTLPDPTCSICGLAIEDLVLIQKKDCLHNFCEWCLEQNTSFEIENEVEIRRCPVALCGVSFKDSDIKHFSPPVPASQKGNAGAKSNKKGKDAQAFRPALSSSQISAMQWLKNYDAGKLDLLKSAKLRGTMGQLCAWRSEAPDDKVIVFTSWRLFSIMLGSMLETRGIGFVYFSGDMSQKQRRAAIERFDNDPSISVMISGLGCGSLGLNLTVANRVILVDPWWNACVENQALGRVFRFGQKKKVYMTRIICDQTVDTEILKLQIKKLQMISDIMDEDPDTLTSEELQSLFGRRTTDGFGNIIIESRYEDWAHWDYADDEDYDSDVGGALVRQQARDAPRTSLTSAFSSLPGLPLEQEFSTNSVPEIGSKSY